MPVISEVDRNLSFLTLEVVNQTERTRSYLQEPTDKGLRSILARDDYIDHLRTIIQRKCFNLAAEHDTADKRELERLKAIDTVTANLERIADFCESIVGQMQHLGSIDLLQEAMPEECLGEILRGLAMIDKALEKRNVSAALDICRIEARLDEFHARTFARVIERLDDGGDAQSLVTVLFISHYFERMGDSMLNIGESILSASLGERIKLEEYEPLRRGVERLGDEVEADAIEIESMAETRSGCRIDRVSTPTGNDGGERMVVFKEGNPRKLREEKEQVDMWNERLPGFAPEIHSFHDEGPHGAILFEYISGRTIEELLLSARDEDLYNGLSRMYRALTEIYEKTKTAERARPRFVSQLRSRLGEVYRVHPDFESDGAQLGGLRIDSFGQLLERAAHFDELEAPFSVLIHGDLNVDNVIFEAGSDRIRFVDLHRSRPMDYVQDLSVHMISHYRLQVFKQPVRVRIAEVTKRTLDFGRGFADRHGDDTFEARLSLGLARSFATSARFILNKDFARNLFQRSRYLVEHLCDTPENKLAAYQLPGEILSD